MRRKVPPTRRKFSSAWDEIDYLYHKLLYWLYDRGDARRALPYADRLEKQLARVASGDEAIRVAECRSLVCEARGDLPGAIRHRENEVRLIPRLHEISANTPGWDLIRQHYDSSDLSDRLDLLAILYHDHGELDRGIDTLERSRQLCEAHGIPFGGRALLRDYLRERKSQARANGGGPVPRRTGTTGH
jgi:hypothetical protein